MAQARLITGDIPGSKEAAELAGRDARAIGSGERLAQAAGARGWYGLAGVPDPLVATLCQEALDALGEDRPELRARTLGLLAFYRGTNESQGLAADPTAAEAVELARQTNDPQLLIDMLFIRGGVTLWASERLDERLAIAEEILDLALADGSTRAPGLRIRAVVRLEAGDLPGFDADLAEMGRLAEAQPFWLFRAIAAMWRTLRVLLEGRFDEAEPMANEMLGLAGSDPNFWNTYAAQLAHLRRDQGRLSELLPLMRARVEETPGLTALRAYLALTYAELGRLDDASAEFNNLAVDGFTGIPRDTTWTISLASLAEVCALVHDTDHANTLYDLLLPRTHQLVVVSWGCTCPGAVDRYLGMLATTSGRIDEAEAHFQAACALEERIGAPPLLARTQYWYARALASRSRKDDADRARALLADSRDIASRLGMAGLNRQATELLATLT